MLEARRCYRPKAARVWDLRTLLSPPSNSSCLFFEFGDGFLNLLSVMTRKVNNSILFFFANRKFRLFDFHNTWVSEFKLLFCASGFCTVMTTVRNSFVTIFQNYLVIIFSNSRIGTRVHDSNTRYHVFLQVDWPPTTKETWFIGELFIWSSLIITPPMQVGLWWER